MNILDSIILGLVQGITEFLPVSSSGHLIIAREFLDLPLSNTLSYDVMLHLATLLVIIFYFWGDLRRIVIDASTEGLSSRSAKMIYAIILGSIPAGIIGFAFGDQIENYFRESDLVAYALIAGSILFWIADRVGKEKGGISPIKGFVIGFFQSLALISGFSRSGSTISGGLILGLGRQEAIKFAFLLGIPITAGAILKTFLSLNSNLLIFQFFNLSTLIGFLVALLSGLWAVRFLVRYLSSNNFTPFIIYRILLAIIILIWL